MRSSSFCLPSHISRILSRANAVVIIYLGCSLPNSSVRCGSFGRAGRRASADSERSCFRWGLPATASPRIAGSSYLPISPLPARGCLVFAGSSLRVASFACATFGRSRLDPTKTRGSRRWPIPSALAGGLFLWHFPSSCPDRTLSCTLPNEARTFLEQTLARDDLAKSV
jgi:hypothetical protein